jgi:hypothetical protein
MVSAAQRLAYRALSVCWLLEDAGADGPEMARRLFGPTGEKEIGHALLELSSAIRTHTQPPPLSHLPEFLGAEIRNLHDSLAYVGTNAPP